MPRMSHLRSGMGVPPMKKDRPATRSVSTGGTPVPLRTPKHHSPRLGVDEAAAQALPHGLGAIGHIELSKRAFQVRLDRVLGDAEHLAEIAVAQPLAEQVQDFIFPARQMRVAFVFA